MKMIRYQVPASRRRGTILPLVVLTMVAMCGFIALGIDIGLIATAKTQLQNAVDAGAMAGARSIDGTPSQNIGAVGTAGSAADNAQSVTLANQVLKTTILSDSAHLNIQFGAWHYDTTTQLFTPNFPPVAPDTYNLCQVTAWFDVQTTFAPVFQLLDPTFNSIFTVTATSQGAHRPRDVAIVLDYSGSMNNESDLWNNESYLGTGSGTNNYLGYTWPKPDSPEFTSNNVETVYPLFGHYSMEKNYTDYVHYANLLSPTADGTSPLTGNSLIGKSNVSISVLGIPAMVGDYYQNARGGTLVSAFTSHPDSYASGTDPNQGDQYLNTSGTSTPASTVAGVFNAVTKLNTGWESTGYNSVTGKPFNGYIQGPRYWGKTYFIWPPDPTNDWRKNFYLQSNGTPFTTADNTKLFANAYPGYLDPPGNYQINYKAILNWITKDGSDPFPPVLRAGYLIFYDSIPTDVPASAYDHTQPNSNITNNNQRFWKEYIDYVLGVWRDPAGAVQHTQMPACSIGPDYVYGTVQISAPPTDGRYMDYNDNVWRPRHRMWFGPMTMIQFLSDTGKLPGTAHDISMFPMKQGVAGALLNIENNHPNDLVALIPFNRPIFANDPPGCGAFPQAQYSLNNGYTAMINSMWLPPNTSTADAYVFDANGVQTPRAFADWTANTTSVHGFMLAYNQFSGATSIQNINGTSGGGFGRKGASRMVIYETDGMANEDSIPLLPFANNGAYQSYYHVLPGDTVNGGGYSQSNLLSVVEAICNLDNGTNMYTPPSGAPVPPAYPGYATVNKPVQIYCVAFGAIFEVPNSAQSSSVPLLQSIASIGGTTFPGSASDPTWGYLWCTGTLQQRQDKLKTAFLKIFNSSVPVSLIK
jgi:Flp pilus assembly protein TadG